MSTMTRPSAFSRENEDLVQLPNGITEGRNASLDRLHTAFETGAFAHAASALRASADDDNVINCCSDGIARVARVPSAARATCDASSRRARVRSSGGATGRDARSRSAWFSAPNTKSRTLRASRKRTSYLRRMHVDVDLARIEFEVQHEHRMAAVEQHVAISLPHRVRDDAILHRAAVDEEVLLIGLRARMRRQPDPAAQSQTVALLRRSAHTPLANPAPSSCATRRRPSASLGARC